MAERWLAHEASQAPISPEPIPVTGLVGVRVTLRSQGFVVGEGEARLHDPARAMDAPGEPVDLTDLLREAVDHAKAGVLDSLADARLRAVLEGRSIPDPVQLSVADIHTRLNIDLALAYGVTPIRVPAGAGNEALAAQFAPGYHGLLLTDSTTGTHAWVWPGEAVARNIAPATQLSLGLKRLGVDRSFLDRLARPEGIGLARFKTLHLVSTNPEDPPSIIVRSGIDQPRYTAEEKDLAALGDRLMEHLYARSTSEERFRGTYHPTSGRYDPDFAEPVQAALACYAMAHHSRFIAEHRDFDNSPAIYFRRAQAVCGPLADAMLRAGEAADPRVVALVLMAMLDLPADQVDSGIRDRLAGLLVDRYGQDPAAHDPPKIPGKAGDLALVAAALTSWHERTREPEAGLLARALIDQLWSDPHKAPSLSALPWLLLAQQRAGGLLDQLEPVRGDDGAPARRNEVIAKMIDRLCQYQVIEPPAFGPDDVLGGFILSPGPAGSPPNPDWRNAQPLMLIALALRDPAITEGHDKLGWMIAASYSARFVGQLMMDDVNGYYVRDRVSARGGVRLAPWDNRLALAPSAMSLLALTELQTTLDGMRPKRTIKPPAVEEVPGEEGADAPATGGDASMAPDVEPVPDGAAESNAP